MNYGRSDDTYNILILMCFGKPNKLVLELVNFADDGIPGCDNRPGTLFVKLNHDEQAGSPFLSAGIAAIHNVLKVFFGM